MRKHLKHLLWISLGLLLVWIVARMLTVNNTITLGSKTFCIPKKYATLDQSTGPLFNIKGADTDYGGSFQTPIKPPEVKHHIADYAMFHGNLPAIFFINVREAPENERKRTHFQKYARDELQLKNKYQDALIQYAPEFNHYRVSEWPQFTPPFGVWDVLKIKPHKNAVIPDKLDDYYVANCYSTGDLAGTNGTSTICHYSLEIGVFLVKITTSENNLPLKEQLSAYARTLLDTWEKNCE